MTALAHSLAWLSPAWGAGLVVTALLALVAMASWGPAARIVRAILSATSQACALLSLALLVGLLLGACVPAYAVAQATVVVLLSVPGLARWVVAGHKPANGPPNKGCHDRRARERAGA